MTVNDGDYLKCVASLTIEGPTEAQNVFYLKLNTAAPWTDANIMVQIVNYLEALYDNLVTSVHASTTLDSVDVHKWVWDAVDGWVTSDFIGNSVLADIFAGTGDALPNAAAAVVSAFAQDVKTRSRKSFPGFNENASTKSFWTSPALVELAAAAIDWFTLFALGGVDSLEPGIPGKGGVWHDIISVLFSTLIGSQRQRKPGIGI